MKPSKVYRLDQNTLDSVKQNRSLSGTIPLQTVSAFKQYTRVTISVDDMSDAQTLTTGNSMLLKYDIVAAVPKTLSAFIHLCKQSEIDIISLDFTHRIPFQIDQKHVSLILKCILCFNCDYRLLLQ